MLLPFRRMARKPTVSSLMTILIVILLYATLHGSNYISQLPTALRSKQTPPSPSEYEDLLKRQGQFWRAFFPDLVAHAPNCEPLVHPEETHLEHFYNASESRPRPDNLTMTGQQLQALHAAHSSFVARLMPTASQEKRHPLPYIKNTRGIVTTAGGAYLPVAVISIRMIRKSESQLPIEVFLANRDEWDPQICGEVFPSLNTRCVVLQDIFDAAGQEGSGSIDKYQYKVMSILFSSFEEVLFMDSDCFSVHDPEQLFLSDPFTSTGLVLWPDFWYPSESSLFFEISSISEPPIHLRASTESGEILYAKPKHALSLLLATYYNYYGPNFYYPLQSQGAPGEGDKETFYWAAIALKEAVYSVRTMVHALGYLTTTGEWRGSAMIQHDPVIDLAAKNTHMTIEDDEDESHEQFVPLPVKPGTEPSVAAAESDPHSSTPRPHARPFFVHANFPKFDPATIFQTNAMGATGPTRDADGTLRRVWQSSEDAAINEFGFDLERRLWTEIRDMACTYEGKLEAWKGKEGICRDATTYWEVVFEGKKGEIKEREEKDGEMKRAER